MKKTNASSRSASRRRLSRAERRRAAAKVHVKLRKPSASMAPVNETTDSCEHVLVPESMSDRPIPGAVDPLNSLEKDFRQSMGWSKPSGSRPDLAINPTVVMRRPAPEIAAGYEFRFVATHRDHYKGEAIRDRATFQAFWDHQINGRPFSMPFLKSGPAIWRSLGIKVSPETTAYMMQANGGVDAETSEAIQAALWSAFNTSRTPTDMEAVVFALATYFHADPLRKHLVSSERYLKPYGDKTEYVLRKVYDLPKDATYGGSGDENKPEPAFDVTEAGKSDEALQVAPIVDSAEPGDLAPGADGEPRPGLRYLPVEADSELRRKIEADSTIDPDHLGTLSELKLLLTSEAEKDRVFPASLNHEWRAILDDLLRVAIREIEIEHSTVVGIVNVMILRMLDIRAALEQKALGRLLNGNQWQVEP